MRPLTAIIIDDEKHARQGLAALLDLYCPQVLVLGDADHVDQGISLIREHKPDVVFLDIQIGEENGFQLLDKLPIINFQLIFTTAYSEFAIKAFRYHAIDYLLKPIEPQQLMAAIDKSTQALDSRTLQDQITALQRYLQFGQQEKMIVPTMDGYHFIKIPSIVHIEGSGNYSTFYLDNGESLMASKHLKFYEEILPVDMFFRVHQSHLVNIRYIKKISTAEGLQVELEEGSLLPLARRRKDDLMNLLGGHV